MDTLYLTISIIYYISSLTGMADFIIYKACKRKTSPVPHEPGIRIIYRNGQGDTRTVLLPDL